MMRRAGLLPLVLGIVLMAHVTRAQEGSISGSVENAEGSPLVGANVIVEGTELGTSTDAEGAYSIPAVPEGTYTVMGSYIGYESSRQTVTVQEGPITVNFTLAPTPPGGRRDTGNRVAL